MQSAPAIPVHPLMAHQAAAFATATMVGLSVSTQMASAFFGMIEGAAEAARLMATPGEASAVEPIEETKVADQPVAAAKAVKAEAAPKPVAAKAKPAVKAPVKVAKPRAKAQPSVARAAAPKADDLKLISGIGPKLQAVLNERGIRAFADIAAWTAEDIALIDEELGFEGRIGRDDWIGQAKALMART